MNKKVRKNLEKLFTENYVLVKNSSIQELFADLIINNPEAYDIGLKINTKLFEDEELERFEEAKNNANLIMLFDQAKRIQDFDSEVIHDFKNDIKEAIELIKKKVREDNKGYENQIIFVEYNYPGIAYFCGFGKQEKFPILEKPEYFNYDYQEELFNGIGKIDYTKFWKSIISIEDLLDELELIDQVEYSEIYQALINSYKFKTYLLLFDAFEQLGIELFDDIPIKRPLYIYGNEHDCEAINIYIYE